MKGKKVFIIGFVIITIILGIGVMTVLGRNNTLFRADRISARNTIPYFTGANVVTYMPEIGPVGQRIPSEVWPVFLEEAKASFKKLYADNVRYVEIVCRIEQEGPLSTSFKVDDAGLSDSQIRQLIQIALNEGITPIIKPHIFVKTDGRGNQRGLIGKTWDDTSADVEQEWFDHYEAFIARYITISNEYDLPYFIIATELPNLVVDTVQTGNRRETSWRNLIKRIRSEYSGKLTYAANSISAADITWWDMVDFIGIDAYFTITDVSSPTLEEIKQGWTENTSKRTRKAFHQKSTEPINIVSQLEKLSTTFNRPIVLTEVGYRSANDAATDQMVTFGIQGWTKRETNYELQANLYRGLFDSFNGKPWFKGVFFWSWYPGQYDPTTPSFQHTHTIQDKPAEAVIREVFASYR